MPWRPVGIVAEGEAIRFGGINPWNHEWIRCPEHDAALPHPQHSTQQHRMSAYAIDVGGRTVVFAVGEVSTNVYAFYVQV